VNLAFTFATSILTISDEGTFIGYLSRAALKMYASIKPGDQSPPQVHPAPLNALDRESTPSFDTNPRRIQ
jgi:hypothetical protein